MAPRKSIPKLEEMCWKTAVHHFDNLKQAEYLPTFFIDKLYKRLSNDNGQIRFPPSNLFFHPEAKDLFSLPHCYSSLEKISRNCKNLRRIVLPLSCGAEPELITTIIVNNPLLIHLDLNKSMQFDDHHLLLISKHCPQLQYLNLKLVEGITDNSIIHLPTTLTYLNVKRTSVTPHGCVTALNKLKFLKTLKHKHWPEIITLLVHNLVTQREPKAVFSIECLKLGSVDHYINFGEMLVCMFPQLREIRLVGLDFDFKSLSENQKMNLITNLEINFNVQDFIHIGKLCPMLEQLVVWFPRFPRRLKISDTTLGKDDYVLFKQLRTLKLKDSGNMRLADLNLLFANVKWLKSLEISAWRQLADEIIYDLLESNLLKGIESIRFCNCGPFKVAALIAILRSIDSLKCMKIAYCKNISANDLSILEKLIYDENWDVSVSVEC